jgi:two-component system LytT family response regulator/two-component system response regulator AlgR
MDSLRVALADDEPLARERLGRLLEEVGCTVCGSFANGEELLGWLRQGHKVDGIFLDIQMPGSSGLEVLAEIPDPPAAVFVTAFADHALRAFDVAAVDYLLKPVFKDRLLRSLDRIRAKRAGTSGGPAAPAVGGTNPGLSAGQERFPVKAGEGHVFLEFRRVSHFEVEDNVVFAWAGGKRFRTSWAALIEVEQVYPTAGMIRIQRHLLLRPEAVLGLKSIPGGRLLARVGEGVDLEVSRGSTSKLRERLGLD